MFPTLETDRLILREITPADASDIFACFSNHDVMRFYGQVPFTTIDEAVQLVSFFSMNYQEKRGIRWGIERKDVKGLIGTIGFNAWSPKHKRAEIGYEIHPTQWRKGYIMEAMQTVLTYGFTSMSLNRIGAIVFIENEASNKLLTKMGFHKEGVLKEYMHQDKKAHDTYVYGLLQQHAAPFKWIVDTKLESE